MKTPTTKTVIVPMIHLNGTSADSLMGAIDAAHDAIGQAYEMLKQCSPNGRDYYTHATAPQAMTTAQDEHRARLLSLHNLQAELYAISLAIDERETTATYEVKT